MGFAIWQLTSREGKWIQGKILSVCASEGSVCETVVYNEPILCFDRRGLYISVTTCPCFVSFQHIPVKRKDLLHYPFSWSDVIMDISSRFH